MITSNVVPGHATIARFVVHEVALAELVGEVLRLCDQAGLVKPGVVAIDGTRLAGNASQHRNREFERIAKEILAEAKATDQPEDEQRGEARGDELPEQLRSAEGGVRQAKQSLKTPPSIGEDACHGDRVVPPHYGEERDRSSTSSESCARGRAIRLSPPLERMGSADDAVFSPGTTG